MSGESSGTRLLNFVQCPRAGLGANLAVSTTASSQDLAAVGVVTPSFGAAASPDGDAVGSVGQYVTFFADGADVGLVFGSSLASVTTTNAPALATTGVNVPGVCFRLNAGTSVRMRVTSKDRYVGFVGSTTGTIRIWPSSQRP